MIVTSSKLITGTTPVPLLNNGAIAFSKGRILAVGPFASIRKRFPMHQVTDLRNAVLLPGLINLHTHLELPPLLNTVRSKTFPGWIITLVQLKKNLSKQDFLVAAKQNIDTLVRTGTTTVGEICTHNISLDLLRYAGLRAIVYREIITGPGDDNQKSILRFPSKADSALVKAGLSPHTPYTVSESILRAIALLAHRKNTPLAMHIAESKDEIRLLQGKVSGLRNIYRLAGWDLALVPSAASSMEYLQRVGFLSPNLLAIHAVQITDKDISLMKKSRISVAHCPRSNKETRVGKMPLRKLLHAGIPVGLGTDSLASSPSLSMWDEMRYAHRIHRRDGITPKDIFTISTLGGARALGLDNNIGSLEPGKYADIIAVPLPQKNTGDIYSDLLRETKSCIMTMVNGKFLHNEY